VGGPECRHCSGPLIKHGIMGGRQRYKCKGCKATQMSFYTNNACNLMINNEIANHVKEGCGIRSIGRLLNISAVTVLRRIKSIADAIKKPTISIGQNYEVDELKTYVKKKTNDYWVIYAIEKKSRQVVDFKAGKRTKKNIKRVTDTLLLAECGQIYTDGLNTYRLVIPKDVHRVKRYSTNIIERKNLNLRTHLKRLNRKTICYSKSLLMLEACLKIYFWYNRADWLLIDNTSVFSLSFAKCNI